MGANIIVYLEVDVSTLDGKDPEYSSYVTRTNDVPYPYYRLIIGRFKVDSCKRNVMTKISHVIAFDALYDKIFERDMTDHVNELIEREGRCGLYEMYSDFHYFFKDFPYIYSELKKENIYTNLERATFTERVLQILFKNEYASFDSDATYYISISAEIGGDDQGSADYSGIYKFRIDRSEYYHNTNITHVSFNMPIANTKNALINSACNQVAAKLRELSSNRISDRIVNFYTNMIRVELEKLDICTYEVEMDPDGYHDLSIQDDGIQGNAYKLNYLYVKIVNTVRITLNYNQSRDDIIFNIVANPAEYGAFSVSIQRDKSMVDALYLTEKVSGLTNRKLLNDFFEICGVYAYVDRESGQIRYKKYDNGSMLYPSYSVKPSSTLYPRNSAESAMKKDILSIQDYVITPVPSIGKLVCEVNEVTHSLTIGSGAGEYDMSDNILFTEGKIHDEHFYETTFSNAISYARTNMTGLGYFKANINMIGLPYLEAGDRISFRYPGIDAYMIIFQRTMTGIQSIKDNFVSEEG